ncbi:unnamed protein product [Allacma fusca]|uniref:glutathione-specific gamma-glutamylcyclotransferase n=1 Tax=Allacma fusca TaxID=39272 RepID=A0A8J2KZD2_9HEXA|nr:unnamed protein product [Allacma fusca]
MFWPINFTKGSSWTSKSSKRKHNGDSRRDGGQVIPIPPAIMWIFGYGSLVWKADFPYVKKIIGYIKGYERKFWQASIDHRGNPEQPGRVVTLIPSQDPEARVWGAAYKIHPRDVENVVKHLDMREVMGYEKTPVDFYPLPHHSSNLLDVQTSSSTSIIAESISNSSMNGYSKTNGENTNNGVGVSNGYVNVTSSQPNLSNGKISNDKEPDVVHQKGTTDKTKNGFIYPQSSSELDSDEDEKINDILEGIVTGHFRVTMYYGNSENAHFVGPAPIEEMASQIYASSGPSGTNKEYLFNLADAMRQICKDAIDPHLAELEMRVRKLEISLTKRKSGRSTPIEL